MRADLHSAARQVEAVFTRHGVSLTLGGEPTYVPHDPQGPEWTITALGPTKLGYAYALADALRREALPHAVDFYCPGKSYPGEINPRWTITLLWNRDGSPLVPGLTQPGKDAPSAKGANAFRRDLTRRLGAKARWLRAVDPYTPRRWAWVLPLDHENGQFVSVDWQLGSKLELLRTDGPAGLRLPLALVPPGVCRRALTVELRDGVLHIFLPPLLQPGFLALLAACAAALRATRPGAVRFAGYLPPDERGLWEKLGIAADPGVLEINLPPCPAWRDYDRWITQLEKAAAHAGLRSYKQAAPGEQLGTGGGNHLLFGGRDFDTHPFFSRPRWITSLLRYWQHHPSLAYLFTGQYVGPSSQAPRPDECAASLYDLEMAYRFLEQLPPGDHRGLISETLRHLHTDASGNTHRSETSFDKFWNTAFDGGCRGLIEFRALESLPHARWMSALALLWRALAARLLDHPFTAPLIDHGDALHDRYFLPSGLTADFDLVLADLDLPRGVFDEIIAWRLPVMLKAPGGLLVRRALEGWPLLCETPLEGGSTSRFVDTSIERLEFSAPPDFTAEVRVQGRPLPFAPLPDGRIGAGLRYRRSALYPCLHPGIPVQLPLFVEIADQPRAWRLDPHRRTFAPCAKKHAPPPAPPCRKLRPDLLTCDLRLP
jgi:uncharacterized protein (DUF2126 family)